MFDLLVYKIVHKGVGSTIVQCFFCKNCGLLLIESDNNKLLQPRFFGLHQGDFKSNYYHISINIIVLN